MRWLLGLVLVILGISPAAAGLTAKEAAEKLGKSVVAVTYKGDTICTAAKIGPSQFLTAGHCLISGEKLTMPNGRILKIKSVLAAFEEKATVGGVSGRDEDWAVLNTVEDDASVVPLELGCAEEPYLGQEIAYAGFPYPTQYALGLGRVTSIKPVLGGRNNLDYAMDVHAAPGASGSAVISLDTGKVVGVLTEGVPARTGFFMVGFESIKNTDMCAGIAGTAAVVAKAAPTADALEK
jgi:V8-like Glu-specific endopeptidase